jgi:MFS family permease
VRLARNVLLLAAASFLADVSGEMLLAVLPFLLVAQGATGVGLGLVSGLSDAVGHLLKPFAGRFADKTGKRKPLIIAGYVVAALSRIGIAFATMWPTSLLFRSSDRLGKGLRTAPRDALLAESVPRAQRGRAFGLHRAADTAGAVVGVGLALLALSVWGASPQTIVLAGALIGLSTVAPLAFVKEVGTLGVPQHDREEKGSPRFGLYVAIAGSFALANVSYLFFVLRATEATTTVGAVALYLLFNVVYVAVAYPAGHLADRVGKPRVLVVGWIVFAMASFVFVASPSLPRGILGFTLLGIAFAVFEGTGRAFAADLAGAKGRSTRLGIFHATVGLSTVAGGLIAGLLWDKVGEWATFAWGGVLAIIAATALAVTFLSQQGPTAAQWP